MAAASQQLQQQNESKDSEKRNKNNRIYSGSVTFVLSAWAEKTMHAFYFFF